MIRKYLVVHYVITMLMIMFFSVVKCSSNKDVVGLSVVFIIPQKKKWKFKIDEKWYSAIKQGVLNNIYKIIGVHLHKEITMNQFYIHNLYDWSYF